MEESMKNKNKQHLAWTVLLIFVLAIILICSFVFIFNYDRAYDDNTGGGFFSPSFGVIIWHYLLAILFIFVAIVLKIVLKKRIRIWTLLLSAILLPILCYHFNHHAFDKEGFLYPLVDKGGIFHFIVIGDYNFDGMNDELYHIKYDERQYSSRYGGHFDDTVIDYIDTVATGTGGGLEGCFCFYKWEDRVIQLFLDQDSVKLKQVEIKMAFQEPSMVHNVSFYLDDSKLNYTINKNNTVSIVFDANTCSGLQNRIDGENRYIPIKYVVNE